MRFFTRISISPYPHKLDRHILDKSFPKKIFVKGYNSSLKYRSYRSYTKLLNKIFIYM